MRTIWLLDDGGVSLGGGQLFALRLARNAGRPVRLVCPPGSPLWDAAEDLDRVAARFPAPVPHKAPSLAAAALGLRRALAAARAEEAVVVSGSIRASMLAGIALTARRDAPPLVHLLHERDSAERASVRIALRRSQRVLTVGSKAAEAYRKALPEASVSQIENFLAPDELARLVAIRRPPRGGPPVLGVLARLIAEKGIDALVDELAAVPDAWAELRVGGPRQDERYAASVERQVAAAGLDDRVRLVGPVGDVPGFLASIDVLVVPSTGNENQPTVILEALAAGVPVVVRSSLWSQAFAGLPVVRYETASELSASLSSAPAPAADPEVVARRFGVEQVVAAIDAIA
jgi:glycosyltransferase involved in cell wall biosynthesis